MSDISSSPSIVRRRRPPSDKSIVNERISGSSLTGASRPLYLFQAATELVYDRLRQITVLLALSRRTQLGAIQY
jgi:hypothetical protein